MHADITEFRGEHRWLSNFWIIPGGITYRGMHAATTEHLYQASKCLRLEDAQWILASKDAGTAKRRGGQIALIDDGIHLRPNWDAEKIQIMGQLTRLKYKEPGLRAQLLDLRGALIVEGNHWGDEFFGTCYGGKKCGKHTPRGQNWLGRILMVERARIIAEETFAARSQTVAQ